jgi:hypothetical protein
LALHSPHSLKLCAGGEFTRTDSAEWVYGDSRLQASRFSRVHDPNFVAFRITHKTKQQITLSLRGKPSDFESFPELPLKKGRGESYSRCTVTNARQLAAAARYIEGAHKNWKNALRGHHPPPVFDPQNLD